MMDWGFYSKKNLHCSSKQGKKERLRQRSVSKELGVFIYSARENGWHGTVRSRKSRHTAFTYIGSALVGIFCFSSSYIYFILVLRSARYTQFLP